MSLGTAKSKVWYTVNAHFRLYIKGKINVICYLEKLELVSSSIVLFIIFTVQVKLEYCAIKENNKPHIKTTSSRVIATLILARG